MVLYRAESKDFKRFNPLIGIDTEITFERGFLPMNTQEVKKKLAELIAQRKLIEKEIAKLLKRIKK